MSKRRVFWQFLIAALLSLSAAIYAQAQRVAPTKQNARETSGADSATTKSSRSAASEDEARYFYEFTQPDFLTSHILIEHDSAGRGTVTFERKGSGDPIVEPLELSPKAIERIKGFWGALRFLDSDASYQSEKQFPHLGTIRIGMKTGARQRTAEFNWTNDPNAKALASEYWHVADQTIFVFDITLARENLPLEAPKIMERLDTLLRTNGLSDPKQLVPLLRELSTDERIPLIARNHAERILKKIEK